MSYTSEYAAGNYAPLCASPVAAGLIDIKLAFPAWINNGDGSYTRGSMVRLGQASDLIDIQTRPFYNKIYGDRNGGQAGPPIEQQYLGRIITINFALSTWNSTAINLLAGYRHGVAAPSAGNNVSNAVGGADWQDNIGRMMMQRGIRLCLDSGSVTSTRNFWCCIAEEPIAVGVGTKFAEYRFSFTAYRSGCNLPTADIIEDTDNTFG